MYGGTHVCPWNILPTSYIGQWYRIDTYDSHVWWYTWESLGYSTYVLHRTVGRDRHIGLTCIVENMGVTGLSYLRPT